MAPVKEKVEAMLDDLFINEQFSLAKTLNQNIKDVNLKKKLVHVLEAQIPDSSTPADKILTNALRANINREDFEIEEYMF